MYNYYTSLVYTSNKYFKSHQHHYGFVASGWTVGQWCGDDSGLQAVSQRKLVS